MRTTVDISKAIQPELEIRAVSNGQSLNALRNDLIERTIHLPDASAKTDSGLAHTLPALARLQSLPPLARRGLTNNSLLADQLLDDDIAKLERIGFMQ